MEIDLTQIIIAVIGLIFTCIIVPVMAAVFKWLRSKTKNEALVAALTEAETIATNVVISLQTNVVEALKIASKDGKLSDQEVSEIKKKAVEMFLSDLSKQSYKVINANADDIGAWVQNLLEKRLLVMKNAS